MTSTFASNFDGTFVSWEDLLNDEEERASIPGYIFRRDEVKEVTGYIIDLSAMGPNKDTPINYAMLAVALSAHPELDWCGLSCVDTIYVVP